MGAVVIRTINESQYEFPVLRPMQVIHLAELYAERERVALVADMDVAGLPADEKFRRLQELREKPESVQAFAVRLTNAKESRECIDMACEGMAEKPPIDDMSATEWAFLALELCNIKTQPVGEDEEEDDLDVNPTDAGTENADSTGTTTQP